MNPYEELGVDRDATQDEIRKAYKVAAHATHPDREGGDEDLFKKASAAYEILRDPVKREYYDRTGDSDANLMDNADRMVMDAFNATIERGFRGDIVEEVSRIIDQLQQQKQEQLSEITTEIEKLSRMANRVKAKGRNLYQQLIESKMHDAESRRQVTEQTINICDVATDRLMDYSDAEPDEVVQAPVGPWSSYTMAGG